MKVVVDIPESLLDELRDAVSRGEYEDAREFVTVALGNQVELERSGGRSENVMTLDEALGEDADPRPDGNPQATVTDAVSSGGPGALSRADYDAVSTVPQPDFDRLDAGPLWGQYNRIFPVKLAVRVLANELRNQAVHATSQVDGSEEEWVSLDRFGSIAGDLAREYGLKIQQADKQQARGRGEKLSAALPVGNDPEKSKERFRTHFIGHTDQSGDLTGAAPHLLFVNIPGDSPGLIGITEVGLRFADLWNPLIDGGANADQPLAADEIAFYLEHVENRLSNEFEAMQFTARAIADGYDRPDSLTDRVATLNDNWSDSQASTVRSGLVSRMYELGLVERERVGQRGIAYVLTEDGTTLITNDT